MVTKIWYSVQNCGDGSAYPMLCSSKELAELDQKYMDEGWNDMSEGWSESCVGCITIESDASIIGVKEKVETPESMVEEIKKWNDVYDPSYPHELVEELNELIQKEMKGTRNE